jgi:hypothetical protein
MPAPRRAAGPGRPPPAAAAAAARAASAGPGPPPARPPTAVLIVDGTNVASGAASIAARWRAASGARAGSLGGATTAALAWLSAAEGWPAVRVALFDPPRVTQEGVGRRAEDGRYLSDRQRPPERPATASTTSGGLAAAARAAGFMPLTPGAEFEADDGAAQVLAALAAAGVDPGAVVVASGDGGWGEAAAAARARFALLPPRWAAGAGPAPRAVAVPPRAARAALAAALGRGRAGVPGAGLAQGTAQRLAERYATLDEVAAAAASGAPPTGARDWRARLAPGAPGLAAARAAAAVLLPRPNAGLSAAKLAEVVAAAAAAAPPRAPPPPPSRAQAWRSPPARARLVALKPRLRRLAAAARAAGWGAAPAAADGAGFPVDLCLTRPAPSPSTISLFIGLPEDYDARLPRDRGRGGAEVAARGARARGARAAALPWWEVDAATGEAELAALVEGLAAAAAAA